MSDATRVRIIRGVPVEPGPLVGGASFSGTGPGGRGASVGGELGTFLALIGEHRRLFEAEAEARLRAAEEKAVELVAQAHAEAEAIRRQAFAEGFAAGERAAREQVDREAEELLRLLRSAVEDAQRARHEALARARSDVLKLALAIAEKVVRRHVETEPGVMEGLLDDLLPRWEGADNVIIRCHPADAPVIEAYLQRLAAAGRPLAEVAVVPTEHITRGGCVVESSYGELDARLETRMGRVAQRLAQWAHGGNGGADGVG